MFTSYSDVFSRIVAYIEPCKTLAHSEPCHIQNPGIYRTQDILRILSKHILAYGILRILSYSELCLIQNPVCLGIFRHIQANSIMIFIITLTFFFTLILILFNEILKDVFFDYNCYVSLCNNCRTL